MNAERDTGRNCREDPAFIPLEPPLTSVRCEPPPLPPALDSALASAQPLRFIILVRVLLSGKWTAILLPLLLILS